MKTQAIWSFECCWSTFKKYYLTPHNFYSWPILIYNFIPSTSNNMELWEGKEIPSFDTK